MRLDQLAPAVGDLGVLARLVEGLSGAQSSQPTARTPSPGCRRARRSSSPAPRRTPSASRRGGRRRTCRRARRPARRRARTARGPAGRGRAPRRRPSSASSCSLMIRSPAFAAGPRVDAEGRDAEVVPDRPRRTAPSLLVDLVEVRNRVPAHGASWGSSLADPGKSSCARCANLRRRHQTSRSRPCRSPGTAPEPDRDPPTGRPATSTSTPRDPLAPLAAEREQRPLHPGARTAWHTHPTARRSTCSRASAAPSAGAADRGHPRRRPRLLRTRRRALARRRPRPFHDPSRDARRRRRGQPCHVGDACHRTRVQGGARHCS